MNILKTNFKYYMGNWMVYKLYLHKVALFKHRTKALHEVFAQQFHGLCVNRRQPDSTGPDRLHPRTVAGTLVVVFNYFCGN